MEAFVAMSAMRLAALGAALLFATAAGAQEVHGPGCSAMAGSVSRELMQRPIGIEKGAGRMHQKVSTSSPAAQAFYDQGLAFLASYVWVEAARSFYQALKLDPDLAMAEIGLAKAYQNADAPDDARAHLDRADALTGKAKVSEKEKAWIRLARQQLDAIQAPDAEQLNRLRDYRGEIDALILMDPNDADAWVLRGNAEEPGAWGRGQAGGVGAIAYYEAALKRNPKHVGAHHFLAHSYENIGQHEEAAKYARLYAADASGVAHAQHMLGHVLPRLGQWKQARDQFLRADAIERAYFAREKVDPADDWHHGHNLHLLGAVYLHLGEDAKAERVLREAYDLPSRGLMSDSYAGPYLQFLLLKGRNDEALAAAQQLAARESLVAKVIAASASGEACLGLGRVDEARAQLARTEELQKQVEQQLANTRYARFGPLIKVQYVDILRGRILLRGDHPEEGEEVLLAVADDVGRNPRLDAWASGMFRADRARADAEKLGRKELAAKIAERTRAFGPPS